MAEWARPAPMRYGQGDAAGKSHNLDVKKFILIAFLDAVGSV